MDADNKDQLVDMTKEELEYFLTGLVAVINERDLVQSELAERAKVSAVNMSRVLNRKSGCSPKWRRKVCVALGVFEEDLVKKGSKEKQKDSRQNNIEKVPGVEAGHINPTDVITAVVTLVDQCQKLDSRMRFWREIFDSLPVPTLIIKDGLVCYQNAKSRAWGNISGTAICDNCVAMDCSNKKECPVHIATETATATEGYQSFGGERYKVKVRPLRVSDHEYFIVTATMVQDDYTSDRRSGEDRREE